MDATPQRKYSRTQLKTVVEYAIGWCGVVFFVVLLTVVFSFLGNLLCAALAGMMMGCGRFSCWRACLVSLLFPGVNATVLLGLGSELPGVQICILSLLCLGVFWIIYLVMYAFSNPQTAVSQTAPAAPEGVGAGAIQASEPEDTTGAPSRERPAPVAAGLTDLQTSASLKLEDLQGLWLARTGDHDPSQNTRRLEILKNRIQLTTVDADGKEMSRVEAQVHLHGAR